MPRYYFNLARSGGFIPDPDGIDLFDDDAARRIAVTVIEEFRTNNGDLHNWEGWWLEIIDRSGRGVAAIPLSPNGIPKSKE